MNDIHKDWVHLWPSLRSHWELARPHIHIGKDFPDRYNLSAKKPYTYAWDYTHQEVRDRKLAIIEELCTHYDVDGFDMDFQRHPFYITSKKGHERADMPIMTQFVRDVRALLDWIGKQKGRRLVLNEIGDPKKLMHKNKHYYVTHDTLRLYLLSITPQPGKERTACSSRSKRATTVIPHSSCQRHRAFDRLP